MPAVAAESGWTRRALCCGDSPSGTPAAAAQPEIASDEFAQA